MSDVWQTLELLRSEDSITRIKAKRRIADLGSECSPATSEIISLLEHGDVVLVDYAMIALRRIGKSSLPHLLNRLENASGDFRVRLLCVLGSINRPFDQIAGILAEALSDTDGNVRMQAARSLTVLYFAMDESERESHDCSFLPTVKWLLEDSQTNPETSGHWATSRLYLKQHADVA
ncbi:HEAT repeat domain-containing protein [Neorhodopirellula pilleata]|uniref:HEAT repeat protein n=1 Tax=Neorhodopirellula pilleata TaxID=2714738 RepID=A0A5C6A0K7_9BACT|nr:HEAT repeat domain-containing protein [Neorhodopirellula pilleata]TWT92946.1 hypothetical protein Pla100_42620 [Neorhodopirellula pilleata]